MVAGAVTRALTLPLKCCKFSTKILPVSGFEGAESVYEKLSVCLSVCLCVCLSVCLLQFIDIIPSGASCYSFLNITSFYQEYQEGDRKKFLDRNTNICY